MHYKTFYIPLVTFTLSLTAMDADASKALTGWQEAARKAAEEQSAAFQKEIETLVKSKGETVGTKQEKERALIDLEAKFTQEKTALLEAIAALHAKSQSLDLDIRKKTKAKQTFEERLERTLLTSNDDDDGEMVTAPQEEAVQQHRSPQKTQPALKPLWVPYEVWNQLPIIAQRFFAVASLP